MNLFRFTSPAQKEVHYTLPKGSTLGEYKKLKAFIESNGRTPNSLRELTLFPVLKNGR
jgi:hypothetical protein